MELVAESGTKEGRAMRSMIALALLLSSIACRQDRYEIVATEGRAYRLDKKTGEVWFIGREKSLRVMTPEETVAKEKEEKKQEIPAENPYRKFYP